MAPRHLGRPRISVLLLLACAYLTHGRAADFQGSEQLWTAAARVNPSSPFTHFRLGVLAFHGGHRATAADEFAAGRWALTAEGRTFHQRDPLITLLWLWTDLTNP